MQTTRAAMMFFAKDNMHAAVMVATSSVRIGFDKGHTIVRYYAKTMKP